VHAADVDDDGETDAGHRIAELTGEELPEDGFDFVEDETTEASASSGSGAHEAASLSGPTDDPSSAPRSPDADLSSARPLRPATRAMRHPARCPATRG
jgi:hypothetical protein